MSAKTKNKSQAKESTKVLQTKRRRRRQWITFMRMIRYGVNNFTRNAWLTIAATAVMTVTLLSIFITGVAQIILQSTVDAISNNVSMSVYLKPGTTKDQMAPIMEEVSKLSTVRAVTFIDSATAQRQIADQNKTDDKFLKALTEAGNSSLPSTVSVTVKDPNNTSQLDNFVRNNKEIKKYVSDTIPPSYLGTKRKIIQTIGQWMQTAQRIGMVASVVFVILSTLIIFNTIRMAIFSRKEEIQMMKLIGADKRFIRGPFIVEAMVYGFIGAVVATALGYGLLMLAESKLQTSGVNVASALDLVTSYIGVVVLAMILLGALIGTISSLMATRRYLRI